MSQERFAVVPGWVLDSSRLSSIEKIVFTGLCLYKNSHGCCFPSVPELTRITSLGKTSVSKALNTLESIGAITRRKRYAAGGGQTSNEFYIANCIPQEFTTRIHAEQEFTTRTGDVRHVNEGSPPEKLREIARAAIIALQLE